MHNQPEKEGNERDHEMNVLQAIIDAEPGTAIVYWSSPSLVRDRESGTPSVELLANAAGEGAWVAYERGYCCLTQRRRPTEEKESVFDYIATRTKNPRIRG